MNVLTSPDFTIDWTTIKEDYYSDKNASLRAWFEQIDRNLREEIKKEWIAGMNRLRVNLAFFLWFPTFASKKGMQNVFSIPSINGSTQNSSQR